MSILTNKWTYPGYVFCPWKPKNKELFLWLFKKTFQTLVCIVISTWIPALLSCVSPKLCSLLSWPLVLLEILLPNFLSHTSKRFIVVSPCINTGSCSRSGSAHFHQCYCFSYCLLCHHIHPCPLCHIVGTLLWSSLLSMCSAADAILTHGTIILWPPFHLDHLNEDSC